MTKYQDIPLTPMQTGQFAVSVMMRYQITHNNAWSNGHWVASGLVVGEAGEKFGEKVAGQKLSKQAIRNDTKHTEYLWSGLTVELHRDDAESYYHNLMSDTPRAFIVCRNDEMDSGQCQPFLVTLSYDEAASYMEVDELVYSVDMPAELYCWVEHFVLEHYVPEKRRKRRRDNWKETSRRDTIK